MIELDIRLLYVLVGFISILLGGLLLILKKASPYVPGPVFWALGNFIRGAGLIYFALYPWPGEFLNITITNLLLVISNSLLILGIWKFKDKKSIPFLLQGLPILSLLVNTLLILVWHNSEIRIVFNSSVFVFYGIIIIYEMVIPYQKAFNYIFRINAFSFLFFSIVMIGRAFLSTYLSTNGIMATNTVNFFTLLLATVMQAVLAYGFIIMVNIRVAENLRKQVSVRDKFLSIIAHDLKNQINIIGGFSELLHNSVRSQNIEKSIQFTDYIRQATIQVTGLLNNLLEWARIKSKINIFSPEKVNLKNLILEEIASNYSIAQNKKIEINFDNIEEDVIVLADNNMIKTIIRNLIINAVKFTNTGGSININIIRMETFAEVSVTDSGIGMSSETISKLFNTESILTTEGTNKEAGSGLGLILCKEFVDQHGGRIWAESVFEYGSSFKFTLPIFK
jgi:signal transduction histidine kinase